MRLSRNTIRMLELLDEQFLDCKDCDLWTGGSSKPYWTPDSRYGIIGEAPGEQEVNNEPFVGKAGRYLWETMEQFGFRKSEFVIVNSVNCRPITGRNANGKPEKYQQEECFQWVRKYLKVVSPEKLLILGNYAMSVVTGRTPAGIINMNGTKSINNFLGVPQVFSVHPSACIYTGTQGKALLSYGIKAFKEVT